MSRVKLGRAKFPVGSIAWGLSLSFLLSCSVDPLEDPREGFNQEAGSDPTKIITGFSDAGIQETPGSDLALTEDTPCTQAGTKQLCSTALAGVCAEGSQLCQPDGQWSDCVPYLQPGALVEACQNGTDDDCDGDVDAADTDCVPCTVGIQEGCNVPGAAGICATGSRICDAAGAWGSCTGPSAQAEACGNGLDDDCDGQADGADSDCMMSDCIGPDGSTILNGQSKSYYQVAAHQNCSTIIEQRTCNVGQLSGSYTFASCVAIPAPCGSSPSGTIETRTMFQSPSVPYGQECQSETQTRTCTDGLWSGWSGTYTAPACSIEPAPTCIDDGISPELAALSGGPYQNCGGWSYPIIFIQANTLAWSGCCGFLVRECQVEGYSTLNRMYCDADADTWCNGIPNGTNSWTCQ